MYAWNQNCSQLDPFSDGIHGLADYHHRNLLFWSHRSQSTLHGYNQDKPRGVHNYKTRDHDVRSLIVLSGRANAGETKEYQRSIICVCPPHPPNRISCYYRHSFECYREQHNRDRQDHLKQKKSNLLISICRLDYAEAKV
jgi:hypothetical protein